MAGTANLLMDMKDELLLRWLSADDMVPIRYAKELQHMRHPGPLIDHQLLLCLFELAGHWGMSSIRISNLRMP